MDSTTQTLATAGDSAAIILIVEDDATNVVVLEGILEAAGYQPAPPER
jgi:hypothetical protein